MSNIKSVIVERGVYFIAEIGQNHQGSLDLAKQMIDSLRGTGVSAIKTAKRDIDRCLTETQKKLVYENAHSFGRTYYDHRKALELSHADFSALKEYAETSGFDFISSFTDQSSLRFLLDIDIKYLKIASQRLVDYPLLHAAAATALPVIISTGMSTLQDVDTAVDIFQPNEKYLLQCTSSYPCRDDELNLRVIETYLKTYGNRIDGVGFSGHHTGIAADLAAYMLGARIIERHYTLDRAMKGSDHAASLEKRGVEYILKYITQIRDSLGSSEKTLLQSEQVAMKKLRADLFERD